MDSVDGALMNLAINRGIHDRLRFYHLNPSGDPARQHGQSRITYALIPSDRDFFQRQRAIIYWGDFLHMRQYHQTVAKRLVQAGICASPESAQARVREVLLQAGEDTPTLKKTLTFGSSLLFNTITDEIAPGYQTDLARFLGSCKSAWFRDVYSAFKASLIRGVAEESCLGVDCATLLDPLQIYPLESRLPREDRIGVFFGRTVGNARKMVEFASALARGLRCKLSWLNWGDENAFPNLRSITADRTIRSLQSSRERSEGSAPDGMAELLRLRAVVTDTYHVCVNAWNLGVPAICTLGDDYDRNRNVNFGDNFARRDKRVVFMSMYDALDFLVRDDELQNGERRKLRVMHLSELIHSGKEIAAVQSRIRAHARLAEEAFVRSLSGLL